MTTSELTNLETQIAAHREFHRKEAVAFSKSPGDFVPFTRTTTVVDNLQKVLDALDNLRPDLEALAGDGDV